MMTMEQKIADLDKKFDGFSSVMDKIIESTKTHHLKHLDIENKDKDFILSAFRLENALSLRVFRQDSFLKIYSEVKFTCPNIKDCIEKMHDYFIVKGGKL